MKIALIAYDGDVASIGALLAALAGGGVNVSHVIQGSTPGAAVAGDDDNGPADASAPAVDSTGLPWDERIHSSSKKLTEAGAWRRRKNISDATVSAVEAELRARGPVAATPAMPAAPAVTTGVPLPPPPAGIATIPPNATMPPVPPLASIPTTPPPMAMPTAPTSPATVPAEPAAPAGLPAPESVTDFNVFMQIISGKLQTGALDGGYFGGLVSRLNQWPAPLPVPMTALTDLASDTYKHLVPFAAQLMQHDGKW